MKTPNEAVDLTALLPSDTAELHIVAPGTNKRTGWVITMAGPGHPQTVALSNENSRKELDRQARIERSRINGRKWTEEAKQADENRREFIESLVARIVTWSPVRIGDETIEFSPKAAVELLLRPHMGPFVGQIVDFLVDDRTFTNASAAS